MTPSLILVFWDLTLTGLWPLEMMKTLISCILDNTGWLLEPWILHLQQHAWLRALRWTGALPGRAPLLRRWTRCLHQLRVTSSQQSWVWSGNLLWHLRPPARSLDSWSQAHLFSYFLKDDFFENMCFNVCTFFSSNKVIEFYSKKTRSRLSTSLVL